MLKQLTTTIALTAASSFAFANTIPDVSQINNMLNQLKQIKWCYYAANCKPSTGAGFALQGTKCHFGVPPNFCGKGYKTYLTSSHCYKTQKKCSEAVHKNVDIYLR